jgi:dipeptidyl aminopeptidase/acylaminoacyl peptidase
MNKIKLMVLLFFLCTGCFTVKTQAESGFLGQDLSMLENSNGKIVKIEYYDFDKNIAENVHELKQEGYKKYFDLYKEYFSYYRMEYLSDGLKVVGFIVKPKKEGKYPVIIYNRGAHKEIGKIDIKELRYLSELAARGYVVIASQYRGNDGEEGKDEIGGGDVNDVLHLVPLAKSLPFTHADQIVMCGGSRGGLMTYLAIKEGADIKAAVVYCGVTDLIQSYNESYHGMKDELEDMIGGTPEEKKEEYIKRSAYYWPEAINTPVLIIHGKYDFNVRVSQAEKLAERLKELNKTYKLIIYNSDHNLNFLSTNEELHQEMFNWFDKYLN